ncbi:hypothetical protein BI364_07895 [Acidihalobacter yilgarnensis]|uniref:phospholipase D n=1 Tax=Acidihalobacter yilgarnensis TaxID=2819280 RepID=A0A1D8ISX6_9GAMM|nr:phospholipase D-like domain-containing protein [Acidihalobacter yilgarnensis]AOU99620.1 hypothetical protein BI364_07895 [Acidihalobacter yilgarnensis]
MLYIEPQAGVQPVVQLIESAHRSVDLNVYMITDRRILAALRADHDRGVRVRVIIPEYPYRAGRRFVATERRELAQSGVVQRYAPPRFEGRYVFDHAKYIVIDGGRRYLVGTANFTYSAFRRNREYLWIGDNQRTGAALAAVFADDWRGRRLQRPLPSPLVASPDSARALAAVIRQPGPVAIETEEFGAVPAIERAVRAKHGDIRILVPARESRHDRRVLAGLAREGAQVRLLRRPYLHAKLILGRGEAFIGSQNFSASSLYRNREIGLRLHGPALARLKTRFDRDWAHARPLDGRD